MIRKILFVLKWLTLIIYSGIVVMAIHNAFQWKAGWFYPKLNFYGLLSILFFFVAIPVFVLMILFYKSKKKWQLVLQALLQVIFFCFLPALLFVFVGFVPSVIWGSHTTKLENYHIYEEDVKEHLNSTNLDIIPSALPRNIQESGYLYEYYVAIDSILSIDASWKYMEEGSYEQEKERVLQKEFTEIYSENGYTVCKMKIHGSNSYAEFGYNDEAKSVFYKIRMVW